MTTDEMEILLANTISEINRLSTSVENIRQVLVEVLSQEQTHKDRERLKGLLAPYQSDAQSHSDSRLVYNPRPLAADSQRCRYQRWQISCCRA